MGVRNLFCSREASRLSLLFGREIVSKKYIEQFLSAMCANFLKISTEYECLGRLSEGMCQNRGWSGKDLHVCDLEGLDSLIVFPPKEGYNREMV